MKVKVTNMTCGHCKMTIEKQLDAKGFKDVNIDLTERTVEVDLAGKDVTELVAAIEEKGYDVEL